ncbi:MAG: hypothetical protein QOC68_2391 [Solirubrobacteraceae bacterium]|jgi:hypothetical protein|nr:hypothetical protein [Solirubrobacteraceae bacterium]
MTLMDEPYLGATPHEVLLSNPARGDHPRVSVVIPVRETSDVASLLERLPGLDGEVILVSVSGGDRAAVRAGFAAARGDCIVVLEGDAETGARDVERFVASLNAGCDSVQRAAA